MQTFIQEVVIAEASFANLKKIFIVPSRRAGSRLRRELALTSKATSFAPEIYSIEEFIAHISGLRQATNAAQLFALYRSYLHHIPKENQESFRTFCGWAQTILADFNEIDRYLISQDAIFNHLKDIKDLTNHWSQDTSSTLVRNYLKFWEDLHALYIHFCEDLSVKGLAHQGLLYRRSVENLETYVQAGAQIRHVFVGFNALNNAEQQLIQGILATGNSAIYWDVEKHFQENPIHEVSTFTNTYTKEWSYFKNEEFTWISENYTQSKVVKTYACTSDIAQAKAIAAIVKELTEEEMEATAIVLGDESLLLPLLNALPSSLSRLNITMGIPLSQTPVASFFDSLFLMKRSPSLKGYYHGEIIEILSHPLVQKLLKGTASTVQQRITKENITFATAQRIESLGGGNTEEPLLLEIFMQWEDPKTAIESCLRLIAMMRRELLDSEDFLQLEYIFGFYKVFNQLASLQQENNYIEDIPTLTFFYRDILSAETVDLRGDPEQGLQIMGVLESRVLDYKRVILSSVNEGILPSGKSQNSFIPYDVKRTYGLPTYFEKDAIYAYHFYRLLHRATKVSLLYKTETDGLGSAEKSRFIRQLEEEGIHTLENINVIPPLHSNNEPPFEVAKSAEIIARLNELCKKGFSPSALTTYLRSPLTFYERYVLGIDESDVVEETVAANTMGTIVHNTLEELYKPFVNQLVTESGLIALLPKIEATVRDQFDKEYGLEFIANGKNLIIYEVVLRYIKNYLLLEINKIKYGDEVIIQSLEDDLRDIPFSESINLRGKVDLVERRNGSINIVDYKTGKVSQTDLNLSHWEDLLLPEGKREKAFQVLMYAYMMNKKQPLDFPVRVGVVSFKNLQGGFLPFRFAKDEMVTEDTLLEFENILKQLLEEILDPSVTFAER